MIDSPGTMGTHLVNRHAIGVCHLIELVDATNATVCENHCTSLEASIAGVFILSHCREMGLCTAKR